MRTFHMDRFTKRRNTRISEVKESLWFEIFFLQEILIFFCCYFLITKEGSGIFKKNLRINDSLNNSKVTMRKLGTYFHWLLVAWVLVFHVVFYLVWVFSSSPNMALLLFPT